jgi:hypothetical protein
MILKEFWSLLDDFLKVIFLHGEIGILSFHNSSSFALRYFFNVNGSRPECVTHPTPLVIIRVAYFRQQRGRALLNPKPSSLVTSGATIHMHHTCSRY